LTRQPEKIPRVTAPGRRLVGVGHRCWSVQLIIDGYIRVKQGRVARIKAQALLLEDGTELPADDITFAAAHISMLETTKKILGAGFADQLREVWGLMEKTGSSRSEGAQDIRAFGLLVATWRCK
jgi:hypothetical protein